MSYPNTYVITEDHVKLLQRLYFRWEDDAYDGAPAVDIKRPYGNSDVLGDVAEILEWELITDRWGDPTMTEEQAERAKELHEQMHMVLQILVQNPTNFSAGTYKNVARSAPYGCEYRKVKL